MDVKKYFIAIVIPEPVYGQIEALKQELYEQRGLKGGLRSPAHITLHRPFTWKENKEGVLIEKLREFRNTTSFEISLENFAFFEPRVIYVNVAPNENLNALYTKLKQFAKKDLRLFNEWEDERGFHPHITIANRDLKKPTFYELQKEFEQKVFKAEFKYERLSLLKMNKSWEVYRQFQTT